MSNSLAKTARLQRPQRSFHHIFAELHKEEQMRTAEFKRMHRRPATVPTDPPTSKGREDLRSQHWTPDGFSCCRRDQISQLSCIRL